MSANRERDPEAADSKEGPHKTLSHAQALAWKNLQPPLSDGALKVVFASSQLPSFFTVMYPFRVLLFSSNLLLLSSFTLNRPLRHWASHK